ncbi:major facilitator superfamily domain-containing protein [Myxozyma melibiosi]|uniref:Major facilitator superfamily domain-containing protein n=1 Tax=Myxozyma melibiosi TaxID=54550 RepID=A0ABR1FD24_9ASCO
MMMTSLCKEYWQIMLAQGITVGLGTGCLFIPAIAVIPQYFTTKRAFASGLVAAGSSLGGVIYPIIFHRLEPRIGFAWTTRTMGFIMLATQALGISVLKLRTTPKFKRAIWDQTALKDPIFVVFTAVIFFAFGGAYIPYYYVKSFANERAGLSSSTSFYMLSIINAGSIFGRIIPNFIADVVGPVNVLIPFTLLTVIIAYSWMAVSSPAGIVLFCAFYGFASGAVVSIPPPALVSLSPDIRTVGTRMGMAFAIAGVGLLIGTPIAGALLKTNLTYDATAIFCGCMCATSLCLMFVTRYLKHGKKFMVFI